MHKKTRNKKFLLGFLIIAVVGIFAVLYFGVFGGQTAQVSRITIGKGASAQLKMSTREWTQLCRDKQPHIEITSPKGGEKYIAGQEMNVTWRSCNVHKNSKITFQLQKSSGANSWAEYVLLPKNTIKGEWANVTHNDGKEVVVLDAIFHDNYKDFPFGDFSLKAVLSPTGGPFEHSSFSTINSFSNGLITVNPPQDEWQRLCSDGKPRLQILSPNGGELYTTDKIPVTWRSCNTTSRMFVRGGLTDMVNGLDHTIHFGTNVNGLGSNTQNDNKEDFTISTFNNLVSGKRFKVTLQLFDTNGPIISEVSNGSGTSKDTFTINKPLDPWAQLCSDGKPHIQIISPNGGEVYRADQKIEMRWKTCNVSANTRILLGTHSTFKGEGNEVATTINDGSELVEYGGWTDFGKYFKAYAAIGGNPAFSDYSDNTFTINKPLDPWVQLCADGKPRVEVLSPNGGETYKAGQKMAITWRSCNVSSSSKVFVSLKSSTGVIPYLTNDPDIPTILSTNDGIETFIIPTSDYSGLVSGLYKAGVAVVVINAGEEIYDDSNNFFTITK